MESSNLSSSKRSLVEEDANISMFRRRNKVIFLVFVLFSISLSLIIAALTIEFVRNYNTNYKPDEFEIPPIQAFCSVSNSSGSCLRALNPIINNRFIVDPYQIFTISLQTAANDLENITSSSILSDSSSSTEFPFKKCSDSLQRGLGQLREMLAKMSVNPFLGSLSDDEREKMMKRIAVAEENGVSCLDDLAEVESAAVGVATAKLLDVNAYLNSAEDFLLGYANILHTYNRNIYRPDRSIIFENFSAIYMSGLQLLFMVGMFCSLFRIR